MIASLLDIAQLRVIMTSSVRNMRHRHGYIGVIVAVLLAPVLAALMITARAGSAMAATLGNMRVTEQIDALETMAIDPVDFLVKPRLAAGVACVPMLTALFILGVEEHIPCSVFR